MDEKLYTKLIRIRMDDRIFDIFADQDHKRAFLEVKKDKYYYPILKDYIRLDSIYNKPFDGILYNQKYTFQRKAYIATIGLGVVLSLGSIVGLHNINQSYKLQREMTNRKVAIEDEQEPEIQVIKITSTKELDDLGIEPVSFSDLRNSLEANKSIQPKYREYVKEYIDLLEKKLPNADYRILNNNIKGYIFNNHYVSKKWDGSFNAANDTINVKEKYLDQDGNEDIERERIVVFHELTHSLNYGYIRLENGTIIYMGFSIDNYGTSFSEAYTTIFTDYLMSDNYEEYFQKDNYNYPSYQETSSLCYQIMKLLNETYTLPDFINYNVSYLENKLKNNGINNAVDLLDTYHDSIYNDEEMTVEETNEFDELRQTVYEKNLINDLEKESSIIKKLIKIEEVSDLLSDKNQFIEIVLNENPETELIRPIDTKETLEEHRETIQTEDGTETKTVINTTSTIKIIGKNKTEKYQGFLPDIKIYRTIENGNIKYHFGHMEEEQIRDFETGNMLDIDEMDMISLVEIIPYYNYEIQNEILKTEDFQEILQEKFNHHEESIQQQREKKRQKEQEKQIIKEKLMVSIMPQIEEAMENNKTDLEMIRIILENVKDEDNIKVAMELLKEVNSNALIHCIDLIKDIGDERIIIEDQHEFIDFMSPNAVVYMTEDENGVKYHLGSYLMIDTDNKESLKLTDIDGEETYLSDCINQKMIPLIELIPEIGNYRFSIEKDFLKSQEFLELMDGRIIESNDNIRNIENEVSHNIR